MSDVGFRSRSYRALGLLLFSLHMSVFLLMRKTRMMIFDYAPLMGASTMYDAA